MPASPDFPLVRASLTCPLCFGAKEAGLVACWACYRRIGLRYGNKDAEVAIAASERLAELGRIDPDTTDRS